MSRHRRIGIIGLALAAAMLAAIGATPAPAIGRKPELAAEPDIALLYAAGKTATPGGPLRGLFYRRIELGDYGLKVHVWSFDKTRFRLRIAGQREKTGTRVRDFLGAADVLAINGGFFERDKEKVLAPSGLVIVDGKEVAPEHERAGSGIVYTRDDGVFIGYRKNLADHSRMKFAVQVGPVLVDPGGKVSVANKQHDRQDRSAVCLSADAFIVVAVEGGLSLFQLASLLAAPVAGGGIGCDVALNLDGGPSTQVAFRAGGQSVALEGGWPFANALIVSPSTAEP